MSAPAMQRFRGFDTETSEAEVRGILGAALKADWRQAFIARGYGWRFDVGAFSTPIVGGGNGTVLDQDQPEFAISVSSGYTLVPLRFSVQCQTPLIATDADESEILIAADVAAAGGALTASNGTVETPTNMRTNTTGQSNATCFSAGTGNITNPTLGVELARKVVTGDVQGTAANALWGMLDLVYEPKHPPFLIGPCAIYGYWGGTVATPGFAQCEFLVIPSSLITGLS